MDKEGRTLDGATHDLSVVVTILTRSLDGYFDGVTEPEEWRSWESKWSSIRRVILERVNATLDVYEAEASGKNLTPRSQMLLDMMALDFEKFGIVPTEDGKLFTFDKNRTGAKSDGEADGSSSS